MSETEICPEVEGGPVEAEQESAPTTTAVVSAEAMLTREFLEHLRKRHPHLRWRSREAHEADHAQNAALKRPYLDHVHGAAPARTWRAPTRRGVPVYRPPASSSPGIDDWGNRTDDRWAASHQVSASRASRQSSREERF